MIAHSAERHPVSSSNPRVWLEITKKKEIIRFHREHPGFTYRKLAVFFSEKWGKKLNRSHIFRVVKNSERILELTGEAEKRKKVTYRKKPKFFV